MMDPTLKTLARITGYAAYWHTPDLYGEVISDLAFALDLQAREGEILPLSYAHNIVPYSDIFPQSPDLIPIGRAVIGEQLIVDEIGLKLVDAEIYNTSQAVDIVKNFQGGTLLYLSICFDPLDFFELERGSYIAQAKLYEIAICQFPRQPLARIAQFAVVLPPDGSSGA